MRKLVLYTLMSLDGAVENPELYFRASQAPNQGPEFDAVMDENEATITGAQDAVLLGRRMYDEWSQYWPAQRNQPFADFINSVRKYVVTSTPLSNEWHNSEPVGGPIADVVQDLKGRPGRDIGIHGSIQLAQSCLVAGLIDELQLVVSPAVGFTGRRLFAGAGDVRRLELLGSRATPSGSLLLRYRVP